MLKVINGSTQFFNNTLEVTKDGVKVGNPPFNGWTLFWAVILAFPGYAIMKSEMVGIGFLVMCAGVIAPWFFTKQPADTRTTYIIDKMEFVQHDRVGTKGIAGSLGGAAVGGVLFGGFGAVVGAVAAGNKVSEFQNIAIKFTDGSWAVVGVEQGYAARVELKKLVSLAGSNNVCPI